MRYFHRTSLAIDDALAAADDYFGQRMQSEDTTGRRRTFRGAIGEVTLDIKAEGGHYTLITATTNDVGESEVDKLVKRFLSVVHQRVHESYEVPQVAPSSQ